MARLMTASCAGRSQIIASLIVRTAVQGNKKERLSEEEAVASVEEFCMAVHDKWPNCLVQFEGVGPPCVCTPQAQWKHTLALAPFSLLCPSQLTTRHGTIAGSLHMSR